MLMSKRVAWLRVRVLILLFHHTAGVPSVTPGSRRASAAWLLLDLLPKALGVSCCIPASQEAWSTPFLWLVAAHSGDSQAHQKLPSSHFCKAAGADAAVPAATGSLAGAVPWAGPSRSQASSCCGAGPWFCCCPLIWPGSVWLQIQQRSRTLQH